MAKTSKTKKDAFSLRVENKHYKIDFRCNTKIKYMYGIIYSVKDDELELIDVSSLPEFLGKLQDISRYFNDGDDFQDLMFSVMENMDCKWMLFHATI